MEGVDALLFDVFGTVVDWHGTVITELKRKAPELTTKDCDAFATEWRHGYIVSTRSIADGGEGPTNIDILHREILDNMLESPRWSHLAAQWNDEDRQDLNLVWHRLNGWPDASRGLYELKKRKIVATLSNGNASLLVDMAKHADLPWDIIFSGDLLGSYKPNPKTYLGAAHHLSVPPSKCAMVAAHIIDLRAAASHGMKTIYVRRSTEDDPSVRDQVKEKKHGGEVDLIVDSFVELAERLG